MKRNLMMIMAAVTTLATASVSMCAAVSLAQDPDQEMAQDVGAVAPPRVDFATVPASRLRLGMTAADVTRIMGEAAKTTSSIVGETEMTRLDFPAAPIPSKVMLADGKVSGVALDVFHVDKGDLPSFTRKAWPGMHSSGVRRALGEPSEIRHHAFFGIKFDQLVYRRSGEGEASVFFVADRVVAKTAGQAIPTGIFRIDLPSPPPADENPVRGPQVGMVEGDIRALYGAEKFHVDYAINGQPASHAIVETRAAGSFTRFTFVDGVLTEFEDLGRLPAEMFQGG
jgi:hypothetical protein